MAKNGVDLGNGLEGLRESYQNNTRKLGTPILISFLNLKAKHIMQSKAKLLTTYKTHNAKLLTICDSHNAKLL